MSHFTVCCRVGAEAIKTLGVEPAVKAMLAPYQENNMGECPEQYLKFIDSEAEFLKEYETESVEMVKLEDGTYVWPWDKRFSVGSGFDTKTVVPPHLTRERVPYKRRYSTFEQFASEYHGHSERDEKTGRYGRWDNPNKKWDWWTIGGRWTGFFPIKAGSELRLGRSGTFGNAPAQGRGDVVSLDEIDFDAITVEMHAAAEKFWSEWQRFLGGERFRGFDGPRDKALRIGLLEVRQGPPLLGEEHRALSWANLVQPGDERRSWHDVFKQITREEFLREYLETFSPIATYAVLDESGWRAPGDMGWFGYSSEEPDEFVKSKRSFIQWLRETPADSLLVIVDCHI